MSSIEAEYARISDAMAGMMGNLLSINPETVDAVVLMEIDGERVSINSIGDLHMVIAALKSALAQLQQEAGAIN